jgi:hypothetical protein
MDALEAGADEGAPGARHSPSLFPLVVEAEGSASVAPMPEAGAGAGAAVHLRAPGSFDCMVLSSLRDPGSPRLAWQDALEMENRGPQASGCAFRLETRPEPGGAWMDLVDEHLSPPRVALGVQGREAPQVRISPDQFLIEAPRGEGRLRFDGHRLRLEGRSAHIEVGLRAVNMHALGPIRFRGEADRNVWLQFQDYG